ncbi:MAG: methionyl-tRNA formyltransferase [Alphaproteobacteria bacterium]|jgi:methionyl-tRNA formyltransferase|nr:methionyl-tRNA formyltransferase [Alphaproteobacteria bacterium]MDP7045058.1 methionyl-tRNA formyltransferase [Alphaproteobacteria bacterium]HAQ33511.1 methionyl-tRNA formyltransferase [Rhodospirillaceae bacterium]|tara:strand:- start:372 stop:1322 length:951 start_codon:yes stop_codon:yes gene_type:complete
MAQHHLRLVFMGSSDFSVPVLAALLEAGHEVKCVYSQPPRLAGRGQKEHSAPVHVYAKAKGIPVHTPESLKGPEEEMAFTAYKADAAVVAAYGLLLPAAFLNAPSLGCLNVHASLLPRWRGATPIQHAILAGDEESGVTIMKVTEELDAGDILLANSVPITPETTARSLHDELSQLGAKLMVMALEAAADGTLAPRLQPQEGITYAKKLTPAEGRLHWQRPASELERQVRAFTPWPGAWFEYETAGKRERIKVLSAKDLAGGGEKPGTVLDDKLTIACGEGVLRICRLQRSGKSAMGVESFLRGFPVPAHTVLPEG